MTNKPTYHHLDLRATIGSYRMSEIRLLLDDASQMPEQSEAVKAALSVYHDLHGKMFPILVALQTRQVEEEAAS